MLSILARRKLLQCMQNKDVCQITSRQQSSNASIRLQSQCSCMLRCMPLVIGTGFAQSPMPRHFEYSGNASPLSAQWQGYIACHDAQVTRLDHNHSAWPRLLSSLFMLDALHDCMKQTQAYRPHDMRLLFVNVCCMHVSPSRMQMNFTAKMNFIVYACMQTVKMNKRVVWPD